MAVLGVAAHAFNPIHLRGIDLWESGPASFTQRVPANTGLHSKSLSQSKHTKKPKQKGRMKVRQIRDYQNSVWELYSRSCAVEGASPLAPLHLYKWGEPTFNPLTPEQTPVECVSC